MIYWVVDVFICYFLYIVPNFGGFLLEFLFEVNVLLEDLLDSLMIRRVFWPFVVCICFGFLMRGSF